MKKALLLPLLLCPLFIMDPIIAQQIFCDSQQCSVVDDSSKSVLKIINLLDETIQISNELEDEELRIGITNELEHCKKTIQVAFFTKNFQGIVDCCECFYENADEIFAECENNFRNEVLSRVRNINKESQNMLKKNKTTQAL